MARKRFYLFWFHNKDDEGRPLDETLIKAAEEIAPVLTRYRHDEVGCDSTANELLQSAIEAASRAKRTGPIENPIAYLTSVYRRIVDDFLDRLNKEMPVDDQFFEELTSSGYVEPFDELVHDHLELEKLMNFMDERATQICEWILQGFTRKEIAGILGVPRNSLSVEFNRALRSAARKSRQRFRKAKKT
jgi:DNA-directed RNA polymerase specialized sigma24 family protein